MVLGTKAIGKKINSMEMDLKLGLMVLLIKVLMSMVKSMVMVALHGLMEAHMMVNL